MLLKLTIASLLLIQAIDQIASKPEVYLYDAPNDTSSRFFMWTRKNEADLVSYPSLDMPGGTHRICHRGGLTLYTGVDYSTSGSYLDYSNIIECTSIGSTIKSFRFPGDPNNATASALTFYSEANFIGTQWAHIVDENNNITSPFSSIYKIGDEPWTFYLAPNYSGFQICLRANTVANIASWGISPGDIRSCRIGCTTNPDYVYDVYEAATNAAEQIKI